MDNEKQLKMQWVTSCNTAHTFLAFVLNDNIWIDLACVKCKEIISNKYPLFRRTKAKID